MTPDDSVTAAELALGLIEGDERAAAMRRVLAEPAFAREVERWRDHFALLFAAGADIAPDAALADHIQSMIESRGDRAAPPAPPSPLARGWRVAAIAMTAVAAVLLVAILLRPAAVPVAPPITPAPQVAIVPPAPLVAAMTPTPDGKDAAAFGVVYDSSQSEVRLAGMVTLPEGRSAQLWSIGADGVPAPIGVIDARKVRVRAADRARLASGVTLAISIEPLGGSPTGKPTGPVVATGPLHQA